jgi:competence protein ComGC
MARPTVRYCPRCRARFTLTEIMVVTLVVAVMVATLLPAVGKAREKARYGRWQGHTSTLRSDEGLVALYDFEDSQGQVVTNRAVGADIPDYVAEKMNGERPASSLTAWAEGRWQGKGALFFAGFPPAWVSIPTTRYLNPKSGAVGVWARPYSEAGHFPYGHPHLFDCNTPAGTNALSLLASPTGELLVNLGDRQAVRVGKEYGQAWHFVVLTWHEGTFKVYWDGQLAMSDSFTPFTEFSPVAAIGSMYGYDATTSTVLNHGGNWAGYIDELFIYTRELTADEVLALYRMGLR